MEINHPGAINPNIVPASHRLGILDTSALNDVREIYDAVRAKLASDGHSDYAPSKRYSDDELLDRLREGRTIGATHGERAVGFVCLGETSPQHPQDGVPGMRVCYDPAHTAVLRNAMVHPDHQGHGLGRRLFQACVDLAREKGYPEIVSGVTAPNVQSWHNLIHAGLKLVQVSPLPPEISPNNTTLAFYFHRRLDGEPMSDPVAIKSRVIDPLAEGALFQKMIDEGWRHSASEKRAGRMMLVLSQFLATGSTKSVSNKRGGWGMERSSTSLPPSLS